MSPKVMGLLRAMGVTLFLGAVLLPLGCGLEEPAISGVHSTPLPRDPRWLPEGVVAQLTACAQPLQVPPPSAEEHPDQFIQFDAQVGRSGEVDRPRLTRSTVGDHGVERCMAGALDGMTLPLSDLVLEAVERNKRQPLSPEARGLVGNAALLMPITLLPAVLTVVRTAIVVTVVVYVSYVIVEEILAHATATTTTTVAAPTATTTATAEPTTTTAPPPAPPGRCLPCLPVPVGGFGYTYDSTAKGNRQHKGMADHTHHFCMNQSPPEKGCRCFWDRKYKHPTPGFSPLPGAVLVTGSAEGGGIAP